MKISNGFKKLEMSNVFKIVLIFVFLFICMCIDNSLAFQNPQPTDDAPTDLIRTIDYTIRPEDTASNSDDIPAFPGAEGWGASAVGGRGGRIVKVTNLNDSGPGSFRHAIEEESGPRTIVFTVGGVINLESELMLPSGDGFVTIAGQTAPGGITISGARFGTDSGNTADRLFNDLVIRFTRFRGVFNMGNPVENPDQRVNYDTVNLARIDNLIIDHSSFSWGCDEVISFPGSKNVTIQWSIISNAGVGATTPYADVLCSHCSHEEGPHNMGTLAGYGSNYFTYHHTLFANNRIRNPYIKSDTTQPFVADCRNLVGYNLSSFIYPENETEVNSVGCYLKIGPDSWGWDDRHPLFALITGSSEPGEQVKFYMTDYAVDTSAVSDERTFTLNQLMRSTDANVYEFLKTPVSAPPVITDTPEIAYERVLDTAGVLPRDPVDEKVIEETRSGTGSWGMPCGVSMESELMGTTAPADNDNDGMADIWEAANGFNNEDGTDGSEDSDGDGYTNLEEYLNDLAAILLNQPVEHLTGGIENIYNPNYDPDNLLPTAPTGLSLIDVDDTSAQIKWNQSTDLSSSDSIEGAVIGYRIDVSTREDFSSRLAEYSDWMVTGSTEAVLKKLQPDTRYFIRIRAEDAAHNLSDYSSVLEFSTSDESSSTTLVDFGSVESENIYELDGWENIIKGTYTNYCYRSVEHAGMTIHIGDNASYNYQGVTGPQYNFSADQAIEVSWYNSSDSTVTFTALLSFTDSDGPDDQWLEMSAVTIPPSDVATSRLEITPELAGQYSLVNVCVNYNNNQDIYCDKIVLVSNSTSAILPEITEQPVSQYIHTGEDVNFTVITEGTPPFSYQWFKDGDEISNATTNTLTLNNVQDVNEGKYCVEVINEVGSETSKEATLIVTDSPPQVDNIEFFVELNTGYLYWTNPVNQGDEWDKILVIRKDGDQNPQDHNDGVEIYDGDGTSILDTNLADGEYTYAIYAYKETETNNIYYEAQTTGISVPGQSNKKLLRIEADDNRSIIIGQNTRGDLYSLWNSEENTIGRGPTGNEIGLWLYSDLIGTGIRQIPTNSRIVNARLVFNIENYSFLNDIDNSNSEIMPHEINIYQINDPDNLGIPYFADKDGIRNGLDYHYRDHRPGINKPWVGIADNGNNDNEEEELLDPEFKGSILELIDDSEPVDTIVFLPEFFEDELKNTLQFDISDAVQNWVNWESSGEDGEVNQGLYISTGKGWKNGEEINLYGATSEEENLTGIRPYLEIIYGIAGDALTGPDPVDGLAVTTENTDEGSITLNWTNPTGTGNSDFAGIKIIRSETVLPYNSYDGNYDLEGLTAVIINRNEIGSSINYSYTDNGLETGKTYYYAVYAFDTEHNYSEPVYLKWTHGSPAAPTISNQTVTAGEISITWDPVSGADTYRIYRRDISAEETEQGESSDDESWQNITSNPGKRMIAEVSASADLSFTENLLRGTYLYQITAVNENGEGPLSEEIEVTVDENNSAVNLPAAPIELTAEVLSGMRVELSWNSGSNINNAFEIVRQKKSGDWELIGVTSFNINKYLDAEIPYESQITYRVRAVNSAGVSAYSNIIELDIPVREINWEVISASLIKVEWTGELPEGTYQVELYDLSNNNSEVILDSQNISGTNYCYFSGLEPRRNYGVKINIHVNTEEFNVESDIIRTDVDVKGGLF